MSIPVPAQLAPAEPSETCPPIFVKLSLEALSALEAGAAPMSIVLEDTGTAKLRLGSSEFSGSLLPEPGVLEIYCAQATNGTAKGPARFQSAGHVGQRLNILKRGQEGAVLRQKRATASPAPVTSTTAKRKRISSTPAAATRAPPSAEVINRVAHALAPAASTAPALARKSNSLLEDVRRVLDIIGEPLNAEKEKRSAADFFSLADEKYKDLNIWTWPYPESEREDVLRLAREAFERLGYPQSDPAWQVLQKPNSDKTEKAHKPKAAREKEKHAVVPTNNGSDKSKSKVVLTQSAERAPVARPKKIARTESAEMHQLAKKFKDTYGEYAKLYKFLSCRKSRPQSQVQRLLNMHRDLETWKQRLWSSVKSNGNPTGPAHVDAHQN